MSSAQFGESPSNRILDNIRRQGHSLNIWHPPHCYDYYNNGGRYLGSIILFRDVTKKPISDDTLAAMAELEPFMIFALSDLIARHQSQKPMDRAFYDAVSEMTEDAELSKQEKRIVIHRLMGQSYKDLADNLHVSVDTVKKHLSQIHKKTQTNGMAELFAKYFSARLFPKELKD
jgi:DNA-binding CsgD family transcriptional regulator